MRTASISILILALSSMPATHAATDFSQLKSIDFAQLDTNHDGYIDADEASAVAALTQAFRTADTDRDGRLSAPEYSAVIGSSTQGK